MLTLEEGRLQASNAVSTRFLSEENKRYMLQNEKKAQGFGLKTCPDGPCGSKTEYLLAAYYIFSYLFSFGGCSVAEGSLTVPLSQQVFISVITALFIPPVTCNLNLFIFTCPRDKDLIFFFFYIFSQMERTRAERQNVCAQRTFEQRHPKDHWPLCYKQRVKLLL